MKPASAGALTHKVRLERRVDGDDGYGNTVAGWAPQFSRRAEIRPSKGGEEVMAARLGGRQPALILLRYDSQTRTIDTEWRVIEIRDEGPDGVEVAYAIRDARDMEGDKQWFTLLVEAGVATG